MGSVVYVLAVVYVLSVVGADQPYKGSVAPGDDHGGKDDDNQIYVYPTGFKGGRYYYGGVYRGSCHNDGLYYRDEESFVICSNGNAYVQPCAPGTKSSGQHRYSPGYYYGYSDFCDINLVDQGYGPAHYAPYGVPTYGGEGGYYGNDEGYNQKKATSYGTEHSYGGQDYNRYGDGYQAKDNSFSSYGSKKDGYASESYKKSDGYGKDSFSKEKSYGSRESYENKETAYEPEKQKYN